MKKWDPCGPLASASISCGPQCFRHISQASACCWAIQGTAWMSAGFDYESKGWWGGKGVPRIKQSHATVAENLVGMQKQDIPVHPVYEIDTGWLRYEMQCSTCLTTMLFLQDNECKNKFLQPIIPCFYFFPIWSTLVSVWNLPRK